MHPLLKTSIKEVFIWFTLPLVFLTFYIFKFHNPAISAASHLYLVSLVAFIGVSLKSHLFRITNKWLAIFLSSLLYATLLYGFILYYSLVIISLQSWGKVITSEIIVSYAMQAQALCDAIGVSYLLLTTSLGVGFIITIIMCYLLLKNPLHTHDIATQNILVSPTLLNLLRLMLLIWAASLVNAYLDKPTSANTKEPVQLTLYSKEISNWQEKILADKLRSARESQGKKLEDVVRSTYVPAKNAKKKNVIIFVVDALRPDHMGVYGYDRDTTPYLSKLANQKKIERFDNVRASCTESSCGIASLLTGRYVHQIHHLPFSVQQVLQLHQYKVHMILSGDHTNFYNLRSVYGNVDSYYDGSMNIGGYMNNDDLIISQTKQLKQWDGQPTMLQFHLMSAHTLGSKLLAYRKFTPSKYYVGKRTGKPEQAYTNNYDNGVLQADAYIHETLDLLSKKNYLSNSIVIITADHGESLGEHEIYAHGNSAQEEQLRIPLILIKLNEQPDIQTTKKALISQTDIAPTILYDLDMPIPESWQGIPLQKEQTHDFSYFQLKPNVGLYDIRNHQQIMKYWFNSDSKNEFVFNVSTDKLEQENLITKVPAEKLAEWRKIAHSTDIH